MTSLERFNKIPLTTRNRILAERVSGITYINENFTYNPYIDLIHAKTVVDEHDFNKAKEWAILLRRIFNDVIPSDITPF